MRVADGMTQNPITVPKSISIIDAKKVMEEKGVRRLPVLNDEQKLVGYVTYNMLDRATKLTAEVESLMITKLLSVTSEEELSTAIRMMIQHKISGIPVIQNGALQGIVTRRDVLRILIEHMTTNQTKNEPWTINNWMSFSPISFSEEQPIFEAREKMIESDVRRVLVLNEEGQLSGIVTRNRIRKASNLKAPLLSIKSPKLVTLAPTDSLETACSIMIDQKISGIPVVDDRKKIVGILSDTDLLKCCFEIFAGDEVELSDGTEVAVIDALKSQYEKEVTRISHQLAWATKRLEMMERSIHLFSHIEDLEGNLEQALKYVTELVPCEAGSILLVDKEHNQFFFSVAFGTNSDQLKEIFVPLDKGIVGACYKEKQVISVSDVKTDSRYYKEVSDAVGFKTNSLVAIPLISNGRCLGVLELLNKKDSNSFIASELQILEKMARIISNLIQLSLRIQ